MRYNLCDRFKVLMSWIALVFCTCGFGLLPKKIGLKLKGGGMIGSAVGLLLAAALEHTGNSWMSIGLIPILLNLGLWATPPAERLLALRWGPMRRHKGEKEVVRDYNVVNIDEVIPGLLFGLIACFHSSWWMAAIGMTFIFRFVDSGKPWPVNVVEDRLQHRYPLDVFMDDLAGAVYAVLIFEAANWYFTQP